MIDKSDKADASRFRWLIDGNGYFLEHEGLCNDQHSEADQDEARKAIDEAIKWQQYYKIKSLNHI